MTLNAKIETIVKSTADLIHKEKLKAVGIVVTDTKTPAVSKIVSQAVEDIRKAVLTHAVVFLKVRDCAGGPPRTGSPKEKKRIQTAEEVLKKLKLKPKKQIPMKPIPTTKSWALKGKNPFVATFTGPSDDVLKIRIRQMVAGRAEGISVQSIFQRLLNHKDTAGKGVVTSPRVARLVNALIKDKFLNRKGKMVHA